MSSDKENKLFTRNLVSFGFVAGGIAICVAAYYLFGSKTSNNKKSNWVITGNKKLSTKKDSYDEKEQSPQAYTNPDGGLKYSMINGIPTVNSSDATYGNLGDMGKHGSLHEYIKYLSSNNGFNSEIGSFYWLNTRVVYITTGALKEQLNKYKLDHRPPLLFEGFMAMNGNTSVQYINGDTYWKRFHNIWRYYYGVKKLDSLQPVLLECINNVLTKWETECIGKNEKSMIIDDITDEIFEMSAAFMIGNIAYGAIENKEEFNNIVKTISNGYFICWDAMEKLLIKQETIDQNLFDKTLNDMKKCVEYMTECVKKQKQNNNFNNNNSNNSDNNNEKQEEKNNQSETTQKQKQKHKSFIELLFENKELYPTLQDIFNEVMIGIAGGTHTTGYTVAWLLYHIACNVNIQDTMYNEILNMDSNSSNNNNNNNNNVDSLVYCKAVNKETLRFDAIAPWSGRVETTKDIELVLSNDKKVVVNKNTPIIESLGNMLQNNDIWQNSNIFDPMRFLNEIKNDKDGGRIKYEPKVLTKEQKQAFQPFGGTGKRICPAYNLFYRESLLFLSLFLKKFKVELVNKDDINDVKHVYGLTTAMSKPVKLKLTLRQ